MRVFGGVFSLISFLLTHPVYADRAIPTMPVYLFAGQSNMEGNVDPELLESLLAILKSNTSGKERKLADILNYWYETYFDGYAQYAASPVVSALEGKELVRLYRSKFIDDQFPDPVPGAFCTSNGNTATPLSDNCGNPFGPELLASRVMAKRSNFSKPFTIVKVALGGTSLAQDWISPSGSGDGHSGPMFKELKNRIASLKDRPESIHPDCLNKKCTWEALVWFQGESDSFDENNARNYRSNLTSFVSDVRAAVGDPRLPVVIVQLNYWANGLQYGSVVTKAQKDFVKSDRDSELVETSDLSRFFHLDSAAQLIIGRRVADALGRVTREPL